MLVGTSENIRLLSTGNSRGFIEWLAGVIDGDGYFGVSKKGYASLEITMELREERALQIIKNVYGGSVKLRAGSNSVRYRLHNKAGMLKVIEDINGLIRNSKRLIQLANVCEIYKIKLIYPGKLDYLSGWLSGMIDSDGTVTINETNNQLSISVSHKTMELLNQINSLYGGYVYIDRGSLKYKWYITRKEDIEKLLEYFKMFPPKTPKVNRILLIPKFYLLKSQGAHRAEKNSNLGKAWNKFYTSFKDYSD